MPYYPPQQVRYTFGPGRLTPAVKLLMSINVAMFVIGTFVPPVVLYLGLAPAAVFGRLAAWQPLTYMFLHDGVLHLLFNMLALWMFGVELERMWGTRFFTRYYLVTGIGAAAVTLALSLLPWRIGTIMYYSLTIGASGAIYGLLLAYGLQFPERPIYLYMVVPVPAKWFVVIMGGLAFLSSIQGAGGGGAHAAHLGGLIVGYVYLQHPRGRPLLDLKYYLTRWRMNRLRRKFEVHQGRRPGPGSRPGPGGWVH
jgi:membrane associated rhomboid family serine protease